MRKSIFIVLSMLCIQKGITQNLVSYVQTLSGTAPSTTKAALKHSEAGSEKNANTIPSVTRPFAMTQWVAQTRRTEQKCIPPYFYKDSLFSGVRASHWLSGSCTQDYGSVTIMPAIGGLPTNPALHSIPFSHSNEKAGPQQYQLRFPKEKLAIRFSATERCGIVNFSVDQSDSLYLLISPNSDENLGFIKIDTITGELWGYNPVHRIYQGWGEYAGFNGWFYMKFDQLFSVSGTYAGAQLYRSTSIKEKAGIGIYLGWKLPAGGSVTATIGTSFTSLEAARKNYQAEIANKTYDQVVRESIQSWEKALGSIQIQTKDEKLKRIFYTAMYHAFQHPRLMSDVEGTYPRFASMNKTDTNKLWLYYDDFSMWDIYRAQLPLLEIIDTARISDFVFSIIEKGKSGGWLPIFPCWNNYTAAMIGDHCIAFISSAYTKGISNYDIGTAYELMRKNAFESPATSKEYVNGMGRRALKSYLKFGYIPMEDSVREAFHQKEQVSRTLEYSFDDYALSLVAKSLGKKKDFKQLTIRSRNYKNVFDPTVNMVRGRFENKTWIQPFLPDSRVAYITEGTPRQYGFYMPQDIPGLTKLMGGKLMLEQSLDSLFLKDEYWHGNEPGHHIPFLYNFTNAPWKTQQVVHKLLKEEYSDGSGGLSGNDDAGQMSAWYIFAAMGLYPVNPVSGEYMISSPALDSIELTVSGNKKFKMIVHRNNERSIYIQSIRLNGAEYKKHSISYQLIQQGGTMEFFLGDQPKKI